MKDRDGDPGGEGAGQKEQTAIRDGLAYQGALEAVFAILIGGGIGYWADGHFGTSPWLLIMGFALGFGSFVLRLFQLGRRLNATAPPGDTKPGER